MENKFEQLLRRTLSEEDSQKLLKEIESDSSLKKDFEEYREAWDLIKVLERRELKEKVSKMVDYTSINRSKSRRWIWYSAASVLIIVLSYWVSIKDTSGERMAKAYFEPYPDKYTSMGQNMEVLSKAMTAYNKKNYAEAKQLYSELTQELQNDISLYEGICLYQMNKKNEAKDIFRKLKEDATHISNEPAFWYLSITHLALNEKDSAILVLSKIKDNPSISFHKEDALEMIEQLK